MGNRFRIRRTLNRSLAGAAPVSDSLGGKTRLGEVMGRDLRLRLGDLGEALLQHAADTGMQLLAPAAQQGGVGCILHQSMLEDVADLRRRAVDEYQASLG